MYNILVCDDERDITDALKIYLTTEGYKVYTAFNGQEAVDVALKEDIQLVIMDIMMPVMDGMTAMTKIREEKNVPVIMLTAKGEDTDKILGLTVGADDYVTKPYNPVELIARVKSQIRRYMTLGGGNIEKECLKNGGIELTNATKEVRLDGEKVNLTPTEFDILKFLMEHVGNVYSPRDIYEAVWHETPYGSESAVAVHIRHLREKIEIDPGNPRYIKVIWGQGYKLEKQ